MNSDREFTRFFCGKTYTASNPRDDEWEPGVERFSLCEKCYATFLRHLDGIRCFEAV